MNIKITALAAAILTASSANAAFEEGNLILFAYDPSDDDTYFVDLGLTGLELQNGASTYFYDSSLQTFLADNPGSQWTIIGSINDPTLVGGPPAQGQSFLNRGVISTSTSGSSVGYDGFTNEQQRLIMNDWIADIQTRSGGSSSFGVAGTDSLTAHGPINGGFFNDSLISVGSIADIFYSQANPADSNTLADFNVVSQINIPLSLTRLDSYGIAVNFTMPVPATAWLFGSALLGLAGITKRKKT